MKTFGSQLNSRIVTRSKHLDQLTLLLRQHLPPECDGHYAVANVLQQQLVIVADSPVWATRLRQLAPRIVTLVQQQLSQIQHIQVKSRPPSASPPRVGPKDAPVVKRAISQHASQQIASAANSIADQPLKDALLKLSRHTRDKS